jgi:hypothetical protein
VAANARKMSDALVQQDLDPMCPPSAVAEA